MDPQRFSLKRPLQNGLLKYFRSQAPPGVTHLSRAKDLQIIVKNVYKAPELVVG